MLDNVVEAMKHLLYTWYILEMRVCDWNYQGKSGDFRPCLFHDYYTVGGKDLANSENTFLCKLLGSGPSPQSCLYYQDFQGSKLPNGCLVNWPNKQILSVFQ